jgi:NAD(P)-dependent dehydrogenase (short-subunit alcohol dehydrogenase family)
VNELVRYDAKRVVVTGAASGVGAELVRVLQDGGAANITTIDIKPGGPVDHPIAADLSTPAGVDSAVAQIDGPVDVLFNNAGVAATFSTDVVMAVNVLAPRRLTAALLERIPAGGAVVNTASTAGGGYTEHVGLIQDLLAIDDWGDALTWVRNHPELTANPYGFSKECAQVYTMQLAPALLSRGVRINSVCPGLIETPLLKDFSDTLGQGVIDWMVSQSGGRRATAREIANVIAFLGSDAATYVTGSNVIVDLGFTACLNTGQLDYTTFQSVL